MILFIHSYYLTRNSTNGSAVKWSRDLSLRFYQFYTYELSYDLNTVLYQFLETGTSDKTFMGRDQELK